MDSPESFEPLSLNGVSGGEKRHWIDNNLDGIKWYCEQFGVEDTCKRFKMERETLERAFKRQGRPMPYTAADRAMDMAILVKQSVVDLRGRVYNLEHDRDVILREVTVKLLDALSESAKRVSKEVESGRSKRLEITDLKLPGPNEHNGE